MSLLTSLISYWKMDEASGTRVDSNGANNLTDNNSTGSTTGKINSAADFNEAALTYLSHADNSDLSTGDIDFTLNFWVKSSDFTISSGFPFIACKGWLSDNSADQEWCVLVNGSPAPFAFYVGSGTSTNNVVNSTGGTPSTGTWYMVTVWHDSVNNLIGIALNAGTADTASHSAGVNDGTRDFSIGARPAGSLGWHGQIDEVGFWKRVLTSGERTQLYNSGAGLAFSSFGGGGATLPGLGNYYRQLCAA